MNSIAKCVLIAVAMMLLSSQSTRADSIEMTIRSQKECPEGLRIDCNARDGLLVFDVYVDAEVITNAGELYKGRAGVSALLNISASEQKIASVLVHGATKQNRTHYQFTISESTAKTSELQLYAYLYEKDGMQTQGGSVKMQVLLGGFEPQPSEATSSK